MDELIHSLITYFKTRLKTQVYGVFAFWWVVLHWEFFYTLLFVDPDQILQKFGLLKNEYLRQYFYNYSEYNFWINFSVTFILAAILTFVVIWLVPKFVLLPAFRIENEHHVDKQGVRLKREKDIEVLKKSLEKEKAEKLAFTEAKAKSVKQIIKSDPTLIWKEEYMELRSSGLYRKFEELIEAIYTYEGSARVVDKRYSPPRTLFELDRDMLAYADTNDLILYDSKANSIALTSKGKYFVKQYQST